MAAWDGRAAAKPTWRMGRDLTGRRLRLSHPGSGDDDLHVLDAAGEAIWTRDGNGQVTRVAYDELGRPVLETSDPGQGPVVRQEWIYGRPEDGGDQRQIGRLRELRDAVGTRALEYDWRGAVTTTTQRFWLTGSGDGDWDEATSALWVEGEGADGPLPGAPLSLDGLDDPTSISEHNVYDTRGRTIATRYAGGVEVREGYDGTGNPASLSVVPSPGDEPIVLIESYERDAAERETTVRYGNGVVARREFDPVTDRLAGLQTTGLAGHLPTWASSARPAGCRWRSSTGARPVSATRGSSAQHGASPTTFTPA